MATASETVDAALGELDRLKKVLYKSGLLRVQSVDERDLAKATAYAWFNKHRGDLGQVLGMPRVKDADDLYTRLLEASDKRSSRSTYRTILKSLRAVLIGLRSQSVVATQSTTDQVPSFSPLIADPTMQKILSDRWLECVVCLNASAPLSATVMMGGLLEALLLGRINRESNQAKIFQAKAAPKDKNGHPRKLSEWGLKDYIDVVHELGWLSVSVKDVGAVLRDYRNYIHPFKQLSHGIHLTLADAQMFWEITKAMTREIVASA